MNDIEKMIDENQAEIISYLKNLLVPKTEDKPKRTPKTMCSINVLGKIYDSTIFTENYTQFLKDISNIHEYSIFKKSLMSHIKRDPSEFSNNATTKSSIVELNNGGYVSCHSSTQIKIKHIEKMCKLINVPVIFDDL
jgi:hypothetical protein